MPPSSSPPQPSSGGNLKYLLLGLLFLGGATGLWFFAGQSKTPPPAPAPPPPPSVERVNPMAQPDLVLDDQKPQDAGAPAPEPTAVKKPPSGHKTADWECSGDIANARAVINENSAQVRSCYERRLKINNVLQGNVRLQLKVGANGKVVATQAGGTLHDEQVFACMRNLASTWSFPAPSGGSCAVVSVPFQFSPKP